MHLPSPVWHKQNPCGTTRQQVRQRREVGHRRRLAAVERVLNGGSPTASLKINEVRHVATGDLEAKRVALDGRAVEKLRVRPYRCNSGHFIDNDLRRWCCADHGQQRDARVISAPFVSVRYAASGHEVEAGIAVLWASVAQSKAAISAGLGLRELRGRARRCRKKRDHRVGDRRARAEDLSFELLLLCDCLWARSRHGDEPRKQTERDDSSHAHSLLLNI